MPESRTTAMADSAAANPNAGAAPTQPTSTPPSAGPLAKATVRASSMRALAAGRSSGVTSEGTSARAASRDEAEQREQRQCQPAGRDQHQDGGKRRGAQRFGARHQFPARDTVG